MEKLITNLQQTYCTRNSYYKSFYETNFVKRPRISASTIYLCPNMDRTIEFEGIVQLFSPPSASTPAPSFSTAGSNTPSY